MIFEHQSKNKILLLFIFGVILLGGAVFLSTKRPKQSEPIFCPQDAKLCADGSYVGRVGPNCDFASCPEGTEAVGEAPAGFGNSQIERALENYLLSQEKFSWQTQGSSHNFCSIENLQPENELFPLYIWAFCGEYKLEDGALKNLSGFSGPLKINFPNELSYYDLSRFSFEAPGDGADYAPDVERIFPGDVRGKISNFNRQSIIKKTEVKALAGITGWEAIKQAISDCTVESVWQAHDHSVSAELKNGGKLSGVEPQIDLIIKAAVAAEEKCGRIIMGTE